MKKFFLAAGFLFALLPVTTHAQSVRNDAIDYVQESGIMFSHDGDFEAEGSVSRLEFTLATVNLLYGDAELEHCFRNIAPSLPVKFTLLFNDVAKDEWYGQQLCVAISMGLVNGNRQGDFRPFDRITTAEASKILAHGYGLIYPAPRPTGIPWFRAPMLALEMKGAVSSSTKPGAELTRGDMAVMFYALRNQERFPLSRLIGIKGTPVQVAALQSDTDVTVSMERVNGFSLLARGQRIKPAKMPARVLPAKADVTISNGASVTITIQSDVKIPEMLSRPSHRLLRERVKESRERFEEMTPALAP